MHNANRNDACYERERERKRERVVGKEYLELKGI